MTEEQRQDDPNESQDLENQDMDMENPTAEEPDRLPEDSEQDDTESNGVGRIELAQDDGKWYWLAFAANGRELATNIIGYSTKKRAKEAARTAGRVLLAANFES